MKWIIEDESYVRNEETGELIAMLPDGVNKDGLKKISVAPEALEAIKNFVDTVNSGTLKPRKAVKTFEEILKKYEEA